MPFLAESETEHVSRKYMPFVHLINRTSPDFVLIVHGKEARYEIIFYTSAKRNMEFADLILTPKVDGVILHSFRYAGVEGTLCITGHHLILSSRNADNQELWILLHCIDAIEKKPVLINNKLVGGSIYLKCKDLQTLSLQLPSSKEFSSVANSIEQISTMTDISHLYPFFYRPMYPIIEDGWSMFRPESEFSKLLAGDEWKISHVNKDFSVCPTYPAVLIVPKRISDDEIIQSACFRDGGRFPIISYRHKNGAVLMRSSQPASGPSIKRCRADEALLNIQLGSSTKGFIFDTWGKGKSNSETDQHYSMWKKVHRAIGHVTSPLSILDSFSKLIEACNDVHSSVDRWLAKLESSSWMNMVLNSLNTACIIAQCLVKEGSPVLVHGSKGLDSTLVVTSLVQIILNPDCRTVRGFQALVDREWVQAGHPFSSRHQNSCYSLPQNRTKNAGSTFVLFLDCIYQLHIQFPCSFEFSTRLLLTFFEHSYFSQYGTFLCDSEKQRSELKVQTRTTSLWSYLNRPEVLRTILNPTYEPDAGVIWPSVAPISLELWSELYLRYVIDQKNPECFINQMQNLMTTLKELRNKHIEIAYDLLKFYLNKSGR